MNEYTKFKKAVPPYEKSKYIIDAKMEKYRYHLGDGDMWPLTWGEDDNLYGAAGDNRKSPMNFWRIQGEPDKPLNEDNFNSFWGFLQAMCVMDCVNNLPVDPLDVLKDLPDVHITHGLKPASLLDIAGTMFMAAETINYGTDPKFTRQTNTNGFIVVSKDYGLTWKHATPINFFTGRLSSCHFIQYGKGYRGNRDNYVYAYFPCGFDGKSYWENGDCMLLGRVPYNRFDYYSILRREQWEFFTGLENNEPQWNKDDTLASPVFTYEKMCGENHVSYNPYIGRYLLGNYSFIDDDMHPRPNHQGIWPESAIRSQLTCYEAPEPWGPWSLFYQDDDWGTYGNYQPSFPTKWMFNNGRTMLVVSSGTFDDYNFVYQRMDIQLANECKYIICNRRE